MAQWVRTSWTKTSRGGPAAARRNAAPIAFRLPAEVAPFVHEVLMREVDDFHPHATIRAEPPGRDAGLRQVGERLRVHPVPSIWGMPRRDRRPPAVLLLPGEWVRWQINYRFVGMSGSDWSYRLDTLNLAYGQVPVDTFLGEPTYLVDERGWLR